MSFAPHAFWQELLPPGTVPDQPPEGFEAAYPAALPEGRQLLLPIRVLPGDGSRAVASLIVNQASFAVEDALAQAMADLARPFAPELVIGVPTLGLPLANNLARRLGHPRMVPLGTSRKFWYDEALSEPLASITSPSPGKTLFLDPRMLPLLEGRRIVVVDDVISSGTSIAAVLRLLAKAGIEPVPILAAMLQTDRWRTPLVSVADKIHAPLLSPFLERTGTGRWLPSS